MSRRVVLGLAFLAALAAGFVLSWQYRNSGQGLVVVKEQRIASVEAEAGEPLLRGSPRDEAVQRLEPEEPVRADAPQDWTITITAADTGQAPGGSWCVPRRTEPEAGVLLRPEEGLVSELRGDATGHVQLPWAPESRWVIAGAPGYTSSVMHLPAEGGTVKVELQRPSRVLQGRVVDDQGSPIKGARVAAFPANVPRLVHVGPGGSLPGRVPALGYQSTESSATGEFSIGVDDSVPVRLAAFADGYVGPRAGASGEGGPSVAGILVKPGVSEVELVLTRSLLYFVQLVDSATRQPLQCSTPREVSVLEPAYRGPMGRERVLFRGEWTATFGCRGAECTAKELDGSRVVGAVRATDFQGGAPDRVRLLIVAPGYQPASVWVPLWTASSERPEWSEVALTWAEAAPPHSVRILLERDYPDDVWEPAPVVLSLPRNPGLPFECRGHRVEGTDIYEFLAVPNMDADAFIHDGTSSARLELRKDQDGGYVARFHPPTGIVIEAVDDSDCPIYDTRAMAVQQTEDSDGASRKLPIRLVFAPWVLGPHPSGLLICQELPFPGTYDLIVGKEGFEAAKQTVTVKVGEITRVKAVLRTPSR